MKHNPTFAFTSELRSILFIEAQRYARFDPVNAALEIGAPSMIAGKEHTGLRGPGLHGQSI